MKKGFLALAAVVALGAFGALGASAREASEGPRHGGDDGNRGFFTNRSFSRSVTFDGAHRNRHSGDDDFVRRFRVDNRGRQFFIPDSRRGSGNSRQFRVDDSGRHGAHHFFDSRTSIHR